MIIKLDCIDSTAFNFPKTMSGIVKKVKNEIPIDSIDPINLIPVLSSKIVSAMPGKVINTVATSIDPK
jgi:hypothetical protein